MRKKIKYIVGEPINTTTLIQKVSMLFIQNGFDKVSESLKKKIDYYYDTPNYDLYKNASFLKIRTSKNKEEKINQEEAFPFLKEMQRKITYDVTNLKLKKVLNIKTDCLIIVLEREKEQICVSLNKSVYTNYELYDTMSGDFIIEIEAKGQRLQEIHDLISKEIPQLVMTPENKYQRGFQKTYHNYMSSLYFNAEYRKVNPELKSVMMIQKLKEKD